jgi:DNA-binding GntR family transcriptional regulator
MNREVSNAADAARGAVVPTSSVQQIRSALREFAVVQQRAGNKLAKLKPPKQAEAANALLARGLRDLAAETRRVVQRLASAKSTKQGLRIVRDSPFKTRIRRE